MAQRITMADLEFVVARINRKAGVPNEGWTKDDSGKYTANIGTYVLSGAYGGWQLQKLVNAGGGVTSITRGYLPKRELYNLAQAYLAGMSA